jgi:hypothetical protein
VRAALLLLLLTNILFLAWSQWVAPSGAAPLPVATPANPASIQLVDKAQIRNGSGQPVASPTETRAACVSIGPFIEGAPMRRVAARLAQLGYETRERLATEDVRVAQWVRVANLATPADADIALNALRAVGVTDAGIVPDDEPGVVVSVGIFSEPARANEAAAAARRAGLEPQVTDRIRTLNVSWLDVDRAANEGLPEFSDFAETAPSGGPPLEMRACPRGG